MQPGGTYVARLYVHRLSVTVPYIFRCLYWGSGSRGTALSISFSALCTCTLLNYL